MRIGIIGHFGGRKVFNDGQTVKTITLYDAMMRRKPESVEIDRIDTYYIKHNPFIFIWQMWKSLCRDKKMVVLLSKNGRTFLFPVLYVFAKAFGKDIYHYGIGGRLANEVRTHKFWRKYVASFRANWMESRLLADQLNKLGIANAKYLPNFKKLTVLDENNLLKEYQAPYRFCLFSRVMEEKGVEDAIRATEEINHRFGAGTAALDIYGPIEQNYHEKFEQCVESAKACCRYCGVVPSTESVESLKDYFMLVFPTHWRHEGIPGTIIDALTAGVPVLSRRWQYCDEMIDDMRTGLVYDFEKPELLVEKMAYAVQNSNTVMQMKPNCLRAAKAYSEEVVMKRISDEMDINFRS